MGIDDAIMAVKLLQPNIAIPMRFNTFDVIKQDSKKFIDRLKVSLTKGVVLGVGESIDLKNGLWTIESVKSIDFEPKISYNF